MKLARIVRNWSGIDLLRQTPGRSGVWGDVRFTMDEVEECDYLIVSNSIPHDIEVVCPPEHVWAIIGEPPEHFAKRWHVDLPAVHRVYTVDPDFSGDRYIHGQAALPWHVDRDYDELVGAVCPDKTRTLSWVTTGKAVFAGHRARLGFLDRLRGRIEFDLFGWDFVPVEDKWDALAPYRYSIAVENHRNPYYWTEKIADCFLAWTMPIYCGCSRITDYFPAEAMVLIDIDDPDVIDKIREAISGDRWQSNLDAIAEARRRVLQQYQLFPFMANEIERMERTWTAAAVPRRVLLHGGEGDPEALPCRARPVSAVIGG